MILQSLYDYYEKLAAQSEIARAYWGEYKISYALNLNKEGKLVGIIPLTDEVGNKKTKLKPKKFILPEASARSSNIEGQFLWDNAKYILGIDGMTVSLKRFEASKNLCSEVLNNCTGVMAVALKRFFVIWRPEVAFSNVILLPYLEDISKGKNLIFAVDGQYIHEDSEIMEAWDRYRQKQIGVIKQQCLITGKEGYIKPTHPSIRGVRGAQSSGAALVSFNSEAYLSYGKEQSYNAPVSEYAAFAYTTALNKLVSDERYHKIIGDTTVVYWAENGEDAYADIVSGAVFGENTVSDDMLGYIFDCIKAGKPFDYEGVPLHSDNKFYILGISPNAARLSVRFFLVDTFGSILSHVREHYERMRIVKPSNYKWEHIPLWAMMAETVNPHSKAKAASPLLAGAVMRSILSGLPYPAALYQAILGRVKADQDKEGEKKKDNTYKITVIKVAIIKAYLMHNYHEEEVTTVALNEESKNIPYVLGRLFAVLEHLQETANPNINSTIKNRYFNSACTSPNVVFPVLLKLSNHHLQKIGNDIGKRIFFEKIIGNLQNKIDMSGNPIPARLSLEDQGKFILGYYHQQQKRYEKKEEV
ncbi:type I-C CRISPR-associated protein Cas8c/Csd1 [Colibacter massiliensis]|uniref:type I-C CRISPR-associated protein Cas8c/Csd1 n=1 Tax=Colibacter massiliensis TaxID=1852379 RepID=UPI003F8FEAF4